jgi:hypothetical protein
LYANLAPETAPRSDRGFGTLLASRYQQDVLVSPVGDVSPYAWERIAPDGSVSNVREDPQDDDTII